MKYYFYLPVNVSASKKKGLIYDITIWKTLFLPFCDKLTSESLTTQIKAEVYKYLWNFLFIFLKYYIIKHILDVFHSWIAIWVFIYHIGQYKFVNFDH